MPPAHSSLACCHWLRYREYSPFVHRLLHCCKSLGENWKGGDLLSLVPFTLAHHFCLSSPGEKRKRKNPLKRKRKKPHRGPVGCFLGRGMLRKLLFKTQFW